MEITYLGHSCFKLKTKQGTVVMDPYAKNVGFSLPSVSADIVTVSHDHFDHNAADKVSGTTRREKPFLINAPGEYEVGGISVFGYPAYHDDQQGAARGRNTVFMVHAEGFSIVHLGDLGHMLSDTLIEEIGSVDVLLCPVAGAFNILDVKTAVEVIKAIEPSYVIPMHYLTEKHDANAFAGMSTLDEFMKAYGVTKEPIASLNISAGTTPENTELVVLNHA